MLNFGFTDFSCPYGQHEFTIVMPFYTLDSHIWDAQESSWREDNRRNRYVRTAANAARHLIPGLPAFAPRHRFCQGTLVDVKIAYT
jgi:hypothetical protein